MSNEKWSEWIEYLGGGQPVSDDTMVQLKYTKHEEPYAHSWNRADFYSWGNGVHAGCYAYRYRIQENEMHPDLEWLARNLSEWPSEPKARSHGIGWNGLGKDGQKPDFIRRVDPLSDKYSYDQWLQARKDLGLIMTDEEESMPAEDWSSTITDTQEEAAMVEDMVDGEKYDDEKPRMDLIPPYMEEEVAMVLAFGAQKYAPDNWRKVTPLRSRYLAAAQRHINALKKGEQMDPESGLHHAAHAACCLMFLGEVELEPSE